MHGDNHPKTVIAFLCLGLISGGGCAPGRIPAHPSQLRFPPLSFSPPEAERVVLSSGAVLFLLPDHSLPLFSLQTLARAGSAYDPAGREGLASLTAAVMRTGGTRTMSPEAVDRELEFMASDITAATDRDSSSLTLSCLSRDREKSLTIYLDILLNPAFSPARIDLRKAEVREDIRRWWDEPGAIVIREFYRLAYGPCPYGHPPIGEPGSMSRISRGDLLSFHKTYFRPSNLIMGAAGDFDRDAVVERLEAALGAQREPTPPPLEPCERREEASLNYIPRVTEQAHLVVGHLGIRRDNPDYFSVMLMNEILGSGGFTSRILERLRSKEGLTYHAASYFTAKAGKGLFYTLCETKERSATQALGMILSEMERIRSEAVSQEELERAKEAVINSFVFRFTKPSQIAGQMIAIEFFGLPRDYLARYIERVSAVSREDVLSAARTYLHPEEATILVLGDREEFSEPLDRFGKVNVLKRKAAEETPAASAPRK